MPPIKVAQKMSFATNGLTGFDEKEKYSNVFFSLSDLRNSKKLWSRIFISQAVVSVSQSQLLVNHIHNFYTHKRSASHSTEFDS